MKKKISPFLRKNSLGPTDVQTFHTVEDITSDVVQLQTHSCGIWFRVFNKKERRKTLQDGSLTLYLDQNREHLEEIKMK